ncbi:MAG: ferrous iron transport protein A [Candidatus Bathyarchaeota archaeon]|nr:ferrous iron transport protein A [Candidatus Bathyarchaeota archaeon]
MVYTVGRMMIPLTALRDGETATVVSIDGGPEMGRRQRRRGFEKRLIDMGLTPGIKVTVVKSAPLHGPIEVIVRGSRLALGRGVAERILVEVERNG